MYGRLGCHELPPGENDATERLTERLAELAATQMQNDLPRSMTERLTELAATQMQKAPTQVQASPPQNLRDRRLLVLRRVEMSAIHMSSAFKKASGVVTRRGVQLGVRSRLRQKVPRCELWQQRYSEENWQISCTSKRIGRLAR